MANNTVKARVQLKCDTEANWEKARNFYPLRGEVIIYLADEFTSFCRLKVGDGTTSVVDLPFLPYTGDGDNIYVLPDKLKHSLTFGADQVYTFDGSTDISIPIYTGITTQESMPVSNDMFSLNHTINTSGEWKKILNTENTFIDKDIDITINTPAATGFMLAAEDITNPIIMGIAENGIYNPKTTIIGNVNVATAGWISSGNHNVFDTNVSIGTVNQSILTNNDTTIVNGSIINPATTAQIIKISEGYNTERTITIGAASDGPAGEITSNHATISTIRAEYNAINDNYDITGSTTIPAPIVNMAGYISSTVGIKNVNIDGATVVATLPKLGITATINGIGTMQPSINKNSATNILQAGNATTIQPINGYYIAVASAANTSTITVEPSVCSTGYGTTTVGQYTVTGNDTLTVGAEASAITYIPIDQASFSNIGTNDTMYTDISDTVPALISGDYLYINAGYTTNQKISLAKLIPNAPGINAVDDYILNGYTAYNNDGTLITGNIPTYTGDYEII